MRLNLIRYERVEAIKLKVNLENEINLSKKTRNVKLRSSGSLAFIKLNIIFP